MALSRMPKAKFSEYIKLQRVRNYIESHPFLFTPDMEFDVNLILAEFGVTPPDFTGLTPTEVITAHNTFLNKRNQWQNRFNRVLAQRGMYMAKRYQQELWHIRSNEGVMKKIRSFSKDSLRQRARGNELRRGFAGYHNRYTASVDDRILWSIVDSADPSGWNPSDYVDPETT